jgi:CRP/FNR family transcriptional regulator, anaerobic regulatory protein
VTRWITRTTLAALPPAAQGRLARLQPIHLPKGTVIFRPGDPAKGFALVLSGRIDVFLTGPTGREILLYVVEPGQSCVQTTLGLLGEQDYSGEAITATDCEVVIIPKQDFLSLMNDSAPFRMFIFAAFAERMQDMTHLLEKVAFQRVESRLARVLLDLAQGDAIHATQAELATRIGSVREVVSRRLDSFARRGWVTTDRGEVLLRDRAALQRLADVDGPA